MIRWIWQRCMEIKVPVQSPVLTAPWNFSLVCTAASSTSQRNRHLRLNISESWSISTKPAPAKVFSISANSNSVLLIFEAKSSGVLLESFHIQCLHEHLDLQMYLGRNPSLPAFTITTSVHVILSCRNDCLPTSNLDSCGSFLTVAAMVSISFMFLICSFRTPPVLSAFLSPAEYKAAFLWWPEMGSSLDPEICLPYRMFLFPCSILSR